MITKAAPCLHSVGYQWQQLSLRAGAAVPLEHLPAPVMPAIPDHQALVACQLQSWSISRALDTSPAVPLISSRTGPSSAKLASECMAVRFLAEQCLQWLFLGFLKYSSLCYCIVLFCPLESSHRQTAFQQPLRKMQGSGERVLHSGCNMTAGMGNLLMPCPA